MPAWGEKRDTTQEAPPRAREVVISINEEACRRCFRCVRVCPSNAFKIDQERVLTIPERCVLCGTCYKLCPHDAIDFVDEVEHILYMLDSGQPMIACLDPTFPAVLDKGTPEQLVTALKVLGFREVWETAFGGELVAAAYARLLDADNDGPHISTFCPPVASYVEKYASQLVRDLVPLSSPMAATAAAIKARCGKEIRVVYIGPCIARIAEANKPGVSNQVDGVLTFNDMVSILNARGIDREAQEPGSFDGPPFYRAGLQGLAGGFSESIGLKLSRMHPEHAVRTRSDRAIRAIRQLNGGLIHASFLDLLLCDGCIHGPIVDSAIPSPSRPEMVVNYIKSRIAEDSAGRIRDEVRSFADLDLTQHFAARRIREIHAREEDIQRVLSDLNKTYPDQNLDCGGCGFHTCRRMAIAMTQGLAEYEMCPHYLLGRVRGFYQSLEKAHAQLKDSHQKLQHAQQQLIQTEKLASLGQMAAGVAHELNNPLGTITMFAGMLKREVADNEKWVKDIDLIVQEAERAAKIVRDLLSFSRKTEVKPGLADLNTLIEETLTLVVKQSLFHNIELRKELDPAIPKTFADPDLLKQVLLNIVLNGAQAMNGQGTLTIASLAREEGKAIEVEITDTGEGIPAEHLGKLFDPFFTTKEKGTGLGLAIVYGIVSRHQGDIRVKSEVGKGTKFTIYLPVLDKTQWASQEEPADAQGPTPAGGSGGRQRQDLIG
jgi:signal transduction histidine kinase/iron only hydrogenase large subunit-like protein